MVVVSLRSDLGYGSLNHTVGVIGEGHAFGIEVRVNAPPPYGDTMAGRVLDWHPQDGKILTGEVTEFNAHYYAALLGGVPGRLLPLPS